MSAVVSFIPVEAPENLQKTLADHHGPTEINCSDGEWANVNSGLGAVNYRNATNVGFIRGLTMGPMQDVVADVIRGWVANDLQIVL
jgi:hypothetical protein